MKRRRSCDPVDGTSKERRVSLHFRELPNDVLGVVFDLAQDVSVLLNFSRVCKNWQTLIKTRLIEKHPRFIVRTDAFFESFECVSDRLTGKLDLSYDNEITWFSLMRFRQIIELNLIGNSRLKIGSIRPMKFEMLSVLKCDANIVSFFSESPFLKTLRVQFHNSKECELFSPFVVSNFFSENIRTSLTYLRLDVLFDNVSSSGESNNLNRILHEISELKNLTRLKETYKDSRLRASNFLDTKRLYFSICTGSYANLKRLEVCHPGWISVLPLFTNLVSLKLFESTDYKGHSAIDVGSLKSLTNLEALKICSDSKDWPIGGEYDYSCLLSLTKLKKLKIRRKVWFTGTELAPLTDLEVLSVDVVGFEPAGVANLTKLKSLRINGVGGFGPDSIEFDVFNRLQSLERLDVRNARCARQIVEPEGPLKRAVDLKANSCDFFMKMQPWFEVENLTSLSLLECHDDEKLYEATVSSISRLRSLASLSIFHFVNEYERSSDMLGYSEPLWKEIAAKCAARLVSLSVDHCVGLTDRVLIEMTNLTSLGVRNCGVTQNGISVLTALTELSWEDFDTRRTFRSRLSFEPLSSLKNLKKLSLFESKGSNATVDTTLYLQKVELYKRLLMLNGSSKRNLLRFHV